MAKHRHLTPASLDLPPVSAQQALAAVGLPRIDCWPKALVADICFIADMLFECDVCLRTPDGMPPKQIDASRLKRLLEQAVASGFAMGLRRYGEELMANEEAAAILDRQATGRRKAQESLKAKGMATRAACKAAAKKLRDSGKSPTPKAIAKCVGISVGHYYRLFPARSSASRKAK